MIKIPAAVGSQNNSEKQTLQNISVNNYSKSRHKFKQLVIYCDGIPHNILGYSHFSIIFTPLPIQWHGKS
jgi:hypothetical protein